MQPDNGFTEYTTPPAAGEAPGAPASDLLRDVFAGDRYHTPGMDFTQAPAPTRPEQVRAERVAPPPPGLIPQPAYRSPGVPRTGEPVRRPTEPSRRPLRVPLTAELSGVGQGLAPVPVRPESQRRPEQPWHGGDPIIGAYERQTAQTVYIAQEAQREAKETGRPVPDLMPYDLRAADLMRLDIRGADGGPHPTRNQARAAINKMVGAGYLREIGMGAYELTEAWYRTQYGGPGGLREQTAAEIARRFAPRPRDPAAEAAEIARLWREQLSRLPVPPPGPDVQAALEAYGQQLRDQRR
ncbi:MAG TPA: hypothetical protein VLI54_02290 [Bacillota bacterium]|nr:hypothetical protein [Bacillota bacterium]